MKTTRIRNTQLARLCMYIHNLITLLPSTRKVNEEEREVPARQCAQTWDTLHRQACPYPDQYHICYTKALHIGTRPEPSQKNKNEASLTPQKARPKAGLPRPSFTVYDILLLRTSAIHPRLPRVLLTLLADGGKRGKVLPTYSLWGTTWPALKLRTVAL